MYKIVRNSPNFNQVQRVDVNVTKYDNVITKATIKISEKVDMTGWPSFPSHLLDNSDFHRPQSN